jgi:hypothetical protein
MSGVFTQSSRVMKTRSPSISTLVSVAVALALLGRIGTAAGAKIDVSKLGPQVGERVPDFSLVDQSGHTQTLQSIMGPAGAMLVFIRSADW